MYLEEGGKSIPEKKLCISWMTLKNSNVFDKGGDLNHMTEDVEKEKMAK